MNEAEKQREKKQEGDDVPTPMPTPSMSEREKMAVALAQKQKGEEQAKRQRKVGEAVDLVSGFIDALAYYYYVQYRGLMQQEVDMVECNFCVEFQHDWVSNPSF